MSDKIDFTREDAIHLLEQAKYLLDDERGFADKLVADRKIKLSIASLIAGLFLLKTEMIQQSIDAAFEISDLVGFVLVAFGFVVAALTVWSLYIVATDHNHRILDKHLRYISICFEMLVRHRIDPVDSGDDADGDTNAVDDEDTFDPKDIFSRACVLLYPDADFVDSLNPEQVGSVVYRIIDFQNAYIELANANKRVHERLEFGTMTLFLALLSAIILSILSIGLTSIAVGQGQESACYAKECWNESHYPNQIVGDGRETSDAEAAQAAEAEEFASQGDEAEAKE